MPRLLSTCSKIVFRSFRRFEKSFDRISRWIGPLFVGIALFAISGCAFAFFEVVYPQQFLQEGTSWTYTVVGSSYCWYMVILFSFHVRTSLHLAQNTHADDKSVDCSTIKRSQLHLVHLKVPLQAHFELGLRSSPLPSALLPPCPLPTLRRDTNELFNPFNPHNRSNTPHPNHLRRPRIR